MLQTREQIYPLEVRVLARLGTPNTEAFARYPFAGHNMQCAIAMLCLPAPLLYYALPAPLLCYAFLRHCHAFLHHCYVMFSCAIAMPFYTIAMLCLSAPLLCYV